jgi:hypothetical protein
MFLAQFLCFNFSDAIIIFAPKITVRAVFLFNLQYNDAQLSWVFQKKKIHNCSFFAATLFGMWSLLFENIFFTFPYHRSLFQKSALHKCNMAVVTRVVDSITDNLSVGV